MIGRPARPLLRIGNQDDTLTVLVYDHNDARVFDLFDAPTDTFLTSDEVTPVPGLDQTLRTALGMMYPVRPTHPRETDDDTALERIAALLRQDDISGADFVQDVAGIVADTGRDISDPTEAEQWEP